MFRNGRFQITDQRNYITCFCDENVKHGEVVVT